MVGGQDHALVALPPGRTWYPLYSRLGGPRAGVENFTSTGIRCLDRPSCIESLYRLRRPGPPVGMHGCKWKFIILSETLRPMFLILSTAEEFLKQFFISRGNITHGNVYMPRTYTSKHTHTYKRLWVAHGDYSSIANSWGGGKRYFGENLKFCRVFQSFHVFISWFLAEFLFVNNDSA